MLCIVPAMHRLALRSGIHLVCFLITGVILTIYTKALSKNDPALLSKPLMAHVSMKCLKTRYQQLVHINCTRDDNKTYLLLFLILAGDIATNPGPTQSKSVYPCGLCENPVTWSTDGVCCDECSLWHHRSCIEMSIADYNLLHRSNVQWLCYKCNSINVDSFTYHSFELKSSNSFSVLSDLNQDCNLTLPPFDESASDLPQHTSTPKSHHTTSKHSTDNCSEGSIGLCLPQKSNLRLMTVNCRSIIDKTAEFATVVQYIKPDIIVGTESWLKGVKPGSPPSQNCINSCEIFSS